MRRTGSHVHYCSNQKAGCRGSYRCSDAYLEQDGSDVFCGVNPMDSELCEDCITSYCAECGSCLNVEKHSDDCPKARAWAV